MLMLYISARANASEFLPSFLQQTALSFYVMLSLILLGLFYVVTTQMRRQLAFGLVLDVVILSLLLYTAGEPDLQLTMLYMVVVAASFMLLHGSQALVITLLAIIFVIYQQFFYAIANSMSLTNLGDALLMSASFLAVGGLSWSLSQRLVQLEKVAARQSKEVERLNVINQEVITQMVNGVIVIDREQVVLANLAAHQLLSITYHDSVQSFHTLADIEKARNNTHQALLLNFEQQLIKQHASTTSAFVVIHYLIVFARYKMSIIQSKLSVRYSANNILNQSYDFKNRYRLLKNIQASCFLNFPDFRQH